jgi:SulP family sulfate permease
LRDWLERAGLPKARAMMLTRAAPLFAVAIGTLAVAGLGLEAAGVPVVGEIPRGLPPLTRPPLDVASILALLPSAGAIGIVGFLESIAVAKGLAARRRERIDANRELIGLGAANLAAAFTGGYPVTGGFSRSAVNADAGARSGLSSLVTAGLVLLTLVALTPLLHDLPRAILAAIVLVAVAKLIDLKTLRDTWRYSRTDGAALLVTFGATLVLGVELGVLSGVVTALLLHTARTSKPHIAIVGRVPGTEHYRNVERHEVETWPHVLAVRIDESLYFANAAFLETWVLNAIAERPEVRDLLLICSAINVVDASAAETLEQVGDELSAAGVRLHLAEVKGPVMDRMARVGLTEHLSGNVYLSTHQAMTALTEAPSPTPDPRLGGLPRPRAAAPTTKGPHPKRSAA